MKTLLNKKTAATLALCLSMSMSTFGQSQVIHLSQNKATVSSIIKAIEKQTQMSVDFSQNTINVNKTVSLKSKSETLGELMNQILAGDNDLTYKIVDRHIIIVKAGKPSAQIAQQGTGKYKLTGTVVDGNGEPIIGASVVEQGTKNGTVTDIDGNFVLNTSKESPTLDISYIGFLSQQVKTRSGVAAKVTMKENAQSLEELVVIGYGMQKKVNLTGSVASIDAKKIEQMPTSNLTSALAGKLSGVYVTQGGGGKPGSSSSMQVRTNDTWNTASPLYVIDGVVRDQFAFDGLDASEVENISVLKDGASAAIYGARAASGVILVTTKKGDIGKPKINYIGSVGWEKATKIPDMLNAYDFATLLNDGLAEQGYNSSNANWFTDDELEYYKTHSYSWVDEAWRDPVITRHSVNVSGGNKAVRYFVGGTFYYETGSFDNLNFRKTNFRSNIEANVTKNLTATLSMSMDTRKDRKPYWYWDSDSDTMYDLYKGLLFRPQMIPGYIDGKPVHNIGNTTFVEWSPLEIINGEHTGYNKKRYTTYNVTVGLKYDVPMVKGLQLNALYNVNSRNTFKKMFCYPYTLYNFKGTGQHGHIPTTEVIGTYTRSDGNFLNESSNLENSYQLTLGANYNHSFGKHNVSGLFVYEQSEGTEDYLMAQGNDFSSMAIDQLDAASSANPRIGGSGYETGRAAYVGRINYNFDERYLLEASFRYDGSTKFAPGHRWGFFPSASAGWRISEEKFFKNNVRFVDYLKLRASIGLLGNDAVGGWQWMQRYNLNSKGGAVFGGAVTSGIWSAGLINPDITWEKTRTIDVGFDSQWLRNRLSFNVDVFFKHTYDILGSRLASMPSTFGATMPQENYGVINGHGVEFELGWHDKIGNDFDYHVNANVSVRTNKYVVKDEAENIRAYQSVIGLNTDRAMGYQATGILRTQADLDALPDDYTIFGMKPELGMLNYRDIRGANSDEPDGKIDSNDQTWIVKHTTPPVSLGLNLGFMWKGLAVDCLLQGNVGHQIVIDQRDQWSTITANNFAFWKDHYTSQNINSEYPRLNNNMASYYSTFWKRDASFVRLKNLNVAYTLPQMWTSKIGIEGVKVFFTGTNLFLLYDKVKYYDPENGSIRNYPLMKSFSFGLNVTI